jgi:dipeptidyl aminopeptidase/acylaminoacyl peptidase
MTALTAEMIVDALTVDDVRVSPDGSHVAFVVAPIGQKEEHPASTIWLARTADPGSARKLTVGTAHDRAPRWSSDGAALFFLSDRTERGVAQLQRIALNGGEADALTEWEPGIATFAPIPGGARVAFLAVDPETDEEKKRKEARDDPEVYGERWPLLKLRLLDLSSREVSTIETLGCRHVVDIAPAPDGSRLAVLAWPTPETDNASWNAEILVVDLTDNAVTSICDLATGASDLCWGGRDLLFIAHRSPASRGGHGIYAVAAAGGEPRQLSPDLDACPIELVTARDGTPFVRMAQGLDSWIGRLDVADRRIERVQWLPGEAWSLDVSADGGTLAVARRTQDDLASVWSGPVGGPWHALTALNPNLEAVSWGAQRPIDWAAPDGLRVEGLLILPPKPPSTGGGSLRPGASDADGPFPLMTLVHGGPYLRYSDGLQLSGEEWGQWLATAGYAVLLPNPRGSSGRGDDFADRVVGATGKEDWSDVEAGIDHLIAAGIADPERLGIGGWSYGGYMTAWAVGQTRRLKLGIMGAGICDFGMMSASSDLPHYAAMTAGSAGWEGCGPHPHDACSPISYARHVTTPVLILHGANDERVPVNQGRFFARALREQNIPNELVIYPREPHEIGERSHQLDLLRRVRNWVERWLGPGWQMPTANRQG